MWQNGRRLIGYDFFVKKLTVLIFRQSTSSHKYNIGAVLTSVYFVV